MSHMVEKRASTVEEATTAALQELGAVRDDVDVEVVNEGRRGLFGSGRRAHVRVSVRVDGTNGAAPPVADDNAGGDVIAAPADSETPDVPAATATASTRGGAANEASRPEESVADDAAAAEQPSDADRIAGLNEEADLAADFVEGLLDILELPGDIEIEVDETQAFVNVVEVGSGLLIGRRGATLDALQELVRAATQRQVERRSHVRVDIEGYRHRQLDKLKDRCRDGIALVRETGEPHRLEPMDAFERKIMHDLVAKTGGVQSTSEGVEPRRRVVIHTVAHE